MKKIIWILFLGMIVFYVNKDTGRYKEGDVLSYVSYNVRKYKDNKDIGLVMPSLEKCAENNGLKIEDIGVKEFTKIKPRDEDFKKNVNELKDLKEIKK